MAPRINQTYRRPRRRPPLRALEDVIAELHARRREWQKVSDLSGVPYPSILKIGCRVNRNPSYANIAKLYDALFCGPRAVQAVVPEPEKEAA